MAKKDKSLTENKDLTVETIESSVESVETLDENQEVGIENSENLDAVQDSADTDETNDDIQEAPAKKEKRPTPAFIVKFKTACKDKFDDIKERVVDFFDSVKSFFKSLSKKNRVAETTVREVVTPDGQVIQEVIETPQLSNGERFKRFLRSQQGWLFVLPAVVLMAIFTFYPIVSSFVNAFREGYNPLNEFGDKWTGVGFENFAAVLRGDTGTGGFNFLQCLTNTLILTFVSVPLSTALALLIAVALNSIKPLQKAYQTILFLPYLTNSLAMGAVFLTFFEVIGTQAQFTSGMGQFGIVNNILGIFGVDPIDWVGGLKIVIDGNSVDYQSLTWQLGEVEIPWTKYLIMIVYEVWSGLPFKILILFSALQSINKQYYDAAKVDGASKMTVLLKITTPLISPMLSYLLITGIMGGMKQYSAVVGIFGPDMDNGAMGTMVGYIYGYIGNDDMGYAYAGSLILFAIIMVITVINLRVSKKRVTY